MLAKRGTLIKLKLCKVLLRPGYFLALLHTIIKGIFQSSNVTL